MASNYDNAAWFYDKLSRFVFGAALIRAQARFLPAIPAGASILIAGGGTGRMLQDIARIHPAGLHITYAELSSKMIARARRRNAGHNQVQFINKPVEQVDAPDGFDVIITPFLLDSLNGDIFPQVFNHLHRVLKPGGLWLCTDFQLTGRWWQRPLLRTMYLFFSMAGCVDTGSLPPITAAFTDKDYKTLESQTFYGDFINAAVYQKQSR